MEFEEQELLTTVLNSTFFSVLSKDEILNIWPHFEKIKIASGLTLFNQGDSSADVYILLKGSLVGTIIGKNKEEKIISKMYPVETVGELGVISAGPRTLSVKALVDSELLKLPEKFFFQMCLDNPKITFQILKVTSLRSIQTIKQLYHGEKLNKFMVFFTANSSVPFNYFLDKLKHYFPYYFPTFYSEKINDIEKFSFFLKENHSTTKYIAIILDKYDFNICNFLKRNETKFFLVASNEMISLSDSCLTIMKFLQDYNLERISLNESKILNLILIHQENSLKPFNTKTWLKNDDFHLHHHVIKDDAKCYRSLIRFITDQAIGLVLGGGGFRGFFHLGVLKAFEKLQIPIDMIGGTSVGACAAAYYNITRDSSISSAIDELTSAFKKSLNIKHITWIITSIFSGDPGTTKFKEFFGNTLIEDLWTPFFCISSNMSQKSEHIHKKGLLWKALRATTAIPGFLPPMVVDGELFYDGGLINNLPIDIMRQFIGVEGKIIASDLTFTQIEKKIYCFPPILNFKDAVLYKLGLAHKNYKFPNFMEIFLDALLLAASFKERQNGLNANVLIQPDCAYVSIFTFSMPQQKILFESGYQQTLQALENFKINEI